MKKYIYSAGVAATLAFALPASASTVIASGCATGVTAATGCLFQTNINSNPDPSNENGYKNAEAAYNALAFADITLNYVWDYTPADGVTETNGVWNMPGYLIDFVAVKSGPTFILYQLATPSSSGNWNTFDIPTNGNAKSAKGLSHLMLFGSQVAVPEPSTWAYLMLGFGALGAAMRRRKQVLRFA